MQIVENKALQFVTRKAEQIAALIPKSKILERNGPLAKVLVHWGHEEWQLLRNLGLKNPPHPILGRYKWPGIYTPFDHQLTTAAFLAANSRCYCLSEPGTGKTNAAAWAADYLLTKKLVKRVLVVCPVSIMDTAWRADLFRTLMHRSVGIASGTKRQREAVIAADYEFVIINFDGVKVVHQALMAGGFDLVIIDEATSVKNAQTERWKALNSLCKPGVRVWAMTGTPAAQSPLDAYGLAKLVRPDSVPRSYGMWRDRVMIKITQFKWVPHTNAKAMVHEVLQPAIRYTKEECLDLPDLLYATRELELSPQQKKYYEQVKTHMVARAAGEEITAANAATLINKLAQIACLAYNTEVLTDEGWIPIQSVTVTHKVWDGEDWVPQGGCVYRGHKPVMQLDGVSLTPDHKVWVGSWKEAKEVLYDYASKGFTRPAVRLPDGYASCGDLQRGVASCAVGMHLRLWKHSSSPKPVFTGQKPGTPAELRVSSWKRDSRNVSRPTVSYLDNCESPVHKPKQQGLGELWRAGYLHVRAVAGKLRHVLARYGSWVLRHTDAGSHRREWALPPGELPVGNGQGAVEQHSEKPHARYPQGINDCDASRGSVWPKDSNPAREAVSLRVGAGESTYDAGEADVYDLINCGPRSRFTVRGDSGIPMVVHNCGAVYTDTGEVIQFDIKNRLAELMEVITGTTHKVLVFVPYRHVLNMLIDELGAALGPEQIAFIHGGVPATQRADIIKQFQTEDRPKVLLLVPQATAHGITLTRADNIVWWGPITSTEVYLQANSRAHRAGQTNKVTVTHLQGSPVERRMYAALQGKVNAHMDLVELYKQEIDNV